MRYRTGRHGERLSQLGYGCMRFTRSGGGIDLPKAEREVMEAVHAGVTYLDTAYIYPGSESAVGEILHRNGCRDRVYLATKLPQYLVRSAKAIDRYFDEELKRLQTGYVDFYLMHMLADVNAWERMKSYGIEAWIAKKKGSGAVRNIGFSFHGGTEAFLQVLDAYDWDFCQIQYNYMDEHTQAGRRGLEAAAARGIPVIIMEPLRGGRLAANLPRGATQLLESDGRGWSPAEWGLRWLWDQPGVTCVLSGMNSLEQVRENCRVAAAAEAGALTEADFALIEALRREIAGAQRVGCTGCGYCQPCPQGVDIPGVFRCWNEIGIDGKGKARKEYMQTTAMRRPSTGVRRCVGCGGCETRCPQRLPIRRLLTAAAAELETPAYRIVEQAYRLLKI